MKFPKKMLGLLASLGLIFNATSVQAAAFTDVTDKTPIVLKQNTGVQISIPGVQTQHIQPNAHYSHESHGSHGSHGSHASHYSYSR